MSLIPDDPVTPYDFEGLAETLECQNETVETSSDEDCTVLHLATEKNVVEDADLLLNNNPEVNAQEENDFSISETLHEDPQQDYPELVKMSLIHNADPSWKIDVTFTPLQVACFSLNLAAVKLLVDHGVKIRNQSTILHYISGDITQFFNLENASYYGRARTIKQEIVEVLLDHGANVHSRDAHGRTPIFYAVKASDVKITKMLLSRGANINATDNKGMTPLRFTTTSRVSIAKDFPFGQASYARYDLQLAKDEYRQQFQPKIFKLLLESGVDFNVKQLRRRKPVQIEERMRRFIRYGIRMNPPQPTKTTELHVAIYKNDIKLVENLIKSGFNIDSQDSFGDTALHRVCQMGRPDIVKMLLAYGADISVLNNRLETPILLAVRGRSDRFVLNYIHEYMIKMKLVKLDPGRHNEAIRLYMPPGQLELYSITCTRELEKMKNTMMGDTGINYFEFLVSNNENLMKYLKNEKIVQVLEARSYRIWFPKFIGIIYYRFNQGINRIKLIDTLWNNNTSNSIFSKIPVECVEKIITYLNNHDLKAFTQFYTH